MKNIETVANAKNYVVIDDGQCVYPVLKSDLGTISKEDLENMTGDEYSAWCCAVPADQRAASVGTQEMIDLCELLAENGAEYWSIG